MRELNNQQIKDIVFNKIKQFRFKVYDIRHPFENDDNIIWFKVKGCRNWRFGMWLFDNSYKDSKFYIFAQHEVMINKFYPSHSDFMVDYTKYQFLHHTKYDVSFSFMDIKQMIGHIKRHPCMAYFGKENYHKSYILYFIKNRADDLKYEYTKIIKDKVRYNWLRLKYTFIRRNKIISSVDLRKLGENHYSKYEININFTKESTDEQECKLLNFYFPKRYYNGIRINLEKDGEDIYYD